MLNFTEQSELSNETRQRELLTRRRIALNDTAIRPFVCPSPGAQLPLTIGTLAACSLARCGLRTGPGTDVDPPRVELPSAGAYRLAAPGPITC